MKSKFLVILILVACLTPLQLGNAAVKAATVAQVGDRCLREGNIATGRAVDGTDLVCMKATLGSSKGELLWWYSKLNPLKMFEIIAPTVSRNSDSADVVASRSADRIGRSLGAALKNENLVRDFSSKNFSGGSGTWALSTFQSYRNRLATSFIASQSLINGLIMTKSTLKLSDSKAIAQLVQEYEAIAVPSNSKYLTLEQLINDLRANPKSVTFIGGLNLNPKDAIYLPQNSGFDVVQKAQTDRSFVALSTSGDFVAQANAGKMRALGVASPQRLTWLKARTLQQQGVNIVFGNWYGVFVPSQFSQSDTSNFIRLLDVLHNSQIWLKTLSDNYWSEGYVGQKDFVAQIDLQTAETKAILEQLGF
jgi:putative tricarboxylic transport membrane protein